MTKFFIHIASVIMLIFATSAQAADDFNFHLRGLVMSQQQAKLSFTQGGILKTMVKNGQKVRKGEVIASINPRDKKLALDKAEAALENAKLKLEIAQHSVDKTQRLIDQNILSPMALTETTFSLKQAQADLRRTRTDYETAKATLSDCQLKAPFNGIIVATHHVKGEWVSPGNAVMELADLDSLELAIDIPPQLLTGLKQNFKTDILNDDGEIVGTATLRSILPFIDAASGLQHATWNVKADKSALLAGRFVTLRYWDNLAQNQPVAEKKSLSKNEPQKQDHPYKTLAQSAQ